MTFCDRTASFDAASRCDVWGCNLTPVERLEKFNTRSGPHGGYLDVCALHLIDHAESHLLA